MLKRFYKKIKLGKHEVYSQRVQRGKYYVMIGDEIEDDVVI